MSDQLDLLQDFVGRARGAQEAVDKILDGYEAPPPVHRDAEDTEHTAAEKVKPRAKALRSMVYELALARGAHGVTGWEAVEELGLQEHETSVRPRLTELAGEKHGRLLRKTRLRRLNRHGNPEVVSVAHRHWDEELHGLQPRPP